MRNKEFARRQLEFYGAMTVGVGEMGRGISKFMIPMPEVLRDYSGDFAAGYLFNWLFNSTMELTPLRRIPENKRLIISAGLTLGVCTAAEVFPLLGTQDLRDIPAAVLGILASYGVRRITQRWIGA